MAYERSIVLLLGAGKAGLTDLRAQLVNTVGATVGSAVATGFTDLGTGTYLWNYNAFPDAHRGAVYFYSNAAPATILTAMEINADQEGALTAAEIWTSPTRTLTQTASQVVDAVAGSTITILRGDENVITLTGLGTLVGRSKLWFTVKFDLSATDEQAILQIEETIGLVRLNGAVSTASWGSLIVDDETTGAVTVRIKPSASLQLIPTGAVHYDIQKLTSTDTITTVVSGVFGITADVTRRIS